MPKLQTDAVHDAEIRFLFQAPGTNGVEIFELQSTPVHGIHQFVAFAEALNLAPRCSFHTPSHEFRVLFPTGSIFLCPPREFFMTKAWLLRLFPLEGAS